MFKEDYILFLEMDVSNEEYWVGTIIEMSLILKCMNSFFRRFSGHNPR